MTAKCNGSYCYPLWEQQPNRVRANTTLLSNEHLATFMKGCCVKLKLDGGCSVSNDRCEMQQNRRALLNIYQDPRLVFDLKKLRSSRSWDTVTEDSLLF